MCELVIGFPTARRVFDKADLADADFAESPPRIFPRLFDQFPQRGFLDGLAGGNMAAASRRLGISERQMGLRVHHYGIRWKSYRPTLS